MKYNNETVNHEGYRVYKEPQARSVGNFHIHAAQVGGGTMIEYEITLRLGGYWDDERSV